MLIASSWIQSRHRIPVPRISLVTALWELCEALAVRAERDKIVLQSPQMSRGVQPPAYERAFEYQILIAWFYGHRPLFTMSITRWTMFE